LISQGMVENRRQIILYTEFRGHLPVFEGIECGVLHIAENDKQ